jgi:uncharacterized protein (TIGR00369 family)
MGVAVTLVTDARVQLQLSVTDAHLQPQGLVHGGVFSGLIETACSIGAMCAAPQDHIVVGVENHTSFLRPVKSGALQVVATPVHVGRRAQLWQADVLDEQERIVATGRVRLFTFLGEGGT